MSQVTSKDDVLDRHALISAVWLPTGFVSLGIFHHGFSSGGPLWVLSGFAAVLAGYALHIIANAEEANMPHEMLGWQM